MSDRTEFFPSSTGAVFEFQLFYQLGTLGTKVNNPLERSETLQN